MKWFKVTDKKPESGSRVACREVIDQHEGEPIYKYGTLEVDGSYTAVNDDPTAKYEHLEWLDESTEDNVI